jgi:hypothetical protein
MAPLLKKKLCAPIYLPPQEMKDAVLMTLKAFESHNPVPLIEASSIYLNQDGSFHFKETDKGSFRMHIEKASLFIANLFSSSESKVSEKHQRLHYARRKLLISILIHAWLWERHEVFDNQGNSIPYQYRKVLAPKDILNFLHTTRGHQEPCSCENIQGFLERVQEVTLFEDKSRWNITGVTGCLLWDKLHDIHKGLWCSCCIGDMVTLPLYSDDDRPPYHQGPLECQEETCC